MTPLDLLLWILVIAVGLVLLLVIGAAAVVFYVITTTKPWTWEPPELEPTYSDKAKTNGHATWMS